MGASNQSVLRYNLQWFAQQGAGGEKTEDPTTKKLNDARDEGQIAKSQEIGSAVVLLGLFVSIKLFLGYMGNAFLEQFEFVYGNITKYVQNDFDRPMVSALIRDSLLQILLISAPIVIIGMIAVLFVNVLQVKWKITLKPLKPKFDKFNPVSGMKKIISKDKIMDLVKSIVKIGLILQVVVNKLKKEWFMLDRLYDMTLEQGIHYIGNLVIDVGMSISFVYLILGLFDLLYQKWKFKKDMMMSKQEIKDEFKQTEGDPQIKGRIKQKMREVSQKRMMQNIPDADVVITNPTHFACAIRYNKEVSEAPILIAKGADLLAQKIKEVAKEHDIELVENKPLARMLYYNVELGDQIPPELYQMTAEVLAYVYGLKQNSY